MNAILITGSRDWNNKKLIEKVLSNYDPQDTIMVVGDARGADTIAYDYWIKHGKVVKMIPDWQTYGRSAGIVRNKEMVDYCLNSKHILAVTVLAFNLGTPGTTHTINYALSKGLEVHVYK